MGLWLKGVSNLYNAQVFLSRSLISGQKLMEKVLVDEIGTGTTMAHYLNPPNNTSVIVWDQEYK